MSKFFRIRYGKVKFLHGYQRLVYNGETIIFRVSVMMHNKEQIVLVVKIFWMI